MTLTGGPMFWILLAMAVVAVFAYFGRLIDLRRADLDYEDFLKGVINVLEGGNDEEALAICEDTTAPVAGIVATAIRHRQAPERLLRDAVDSQGRAEAARMNRRLTSLAIIGQIAPLCGLLGTIIGFIKAVMLVDASVLVSRPELMNAAMEALVPSALGLMVAIPVAVMYGSLRSRLERTVAEMEAVASRIVGYFCGLQDHSGEGER